jgi:Tfp pilus assembly protein PilX
MLDTKRESKTSNGSPGFAEEKGIVYIAVLPLILILALVGNIAVITTNTDIKISGNYKANVKALYAAQAEIEEARARLRGPSSANNYAGDPAASPNANWSAYILTSNTWQTSDDPNYNISFTNYIPQYSPLNHTNTSVVANSLQTGISYWVKIRHKREYDAEQAGHTTTSTHYYDDDGSAATHTPGTPGNIIYYGYYDPSAPTTSIQFTTTGTTVYKPVEIISVYGNSGNSSKIIEIEVIHYPGPPILASLYSMGDVSLNGASSTIDGTDNCGDNAALPPIYILSPATLTENPSPTYGGNPPSPLIGSIYIDIMEYINALKSGATITITDDQNGVTYGNASDFVTCYSDTSNPPNNQGLKLENVTGYGTLLVKGDLTLGGGFTWYGLVLTSGTLVLNGGGSGINITGVAMSVETITINGDLNILHDSCEIDNSLNNQSLNVIRWREIY